MKPVTDQAKETCAGRTFSGRAGRPPLASTLWLAEQSRQIGPDRSYWFLFRRWLLEYTKEMGYAPADPEGSFKTAARRIRAHLSQQGAEAL